MHCRFPKFDMINLQGNAAGVTNALLLHPLATVKYACWGQPAEGGRFWPVVRHIYSEGGMRPFLRGALATVMRDLTFGVSQRMQYTAHQIITRKHACLRSLRVCHSLPRVCSRPFAIR